MSLREANDSERRSNPRIVLEIASGYINTKAVEKSTAFVLSFLFDQSADAGTVFISNASLGCGFAAMRKPTNIMTAEINSPT